MCVFKRDKVVIISNPASVISTVYWDRPRTTNAPQIHVEAGLPDENSAFRSKEREEMRGEVSFKRDRAAMHVRTIPEIDLSDSSPRADRVSCEEVLLISSGRDALLFICSAQCKKSTKSDRFHFDLNISDKINGTW